MSLRHLRVLACVVPWIAACHGDDSNTDGGSLIVDTDASNSFTTFSSAASSDGEGTSTAGSSSDSGLGTSGASGMSETSSTGGGVDGCSLSDPCDDGTYCTAPYANNERGPFACTDACIELEDPASWCFDATACCDPNAYCSSRGYCLLPDDTDGSTTAADSTG